MMAQAARDWSVFKQIFADHWDEFKHAHPRYHNAYYDGLVANMLSMWQPGQDGLYRIPLRVVWTRQAPGVDEL
jgi:hypothetical protein